MQKSKPYSLFLPCKMVSIIDEIPNINKERMYILMNSIIFTMAKHSDKEFIFIDKEKFYKKYKFKIEGLLPKLFEHKVLITDGLYIPKRKRLLYKINESLIDDLKLVNINPGSKQYDKIINKLKNDRKNYNLLPPHLRAIQKKFDRLEIDDKIAQEIIKNNEEINSSNYRILFNKNAVLRMLDKRSRYFKRNNTNNRLDTNCTNIKRELKYAIKGDFTNIDKKNSQPSLLAILLNEIFNDNHVSKLKQNPNLLSSKENDMVNSISVYFTKQNFISVFGIKVFTDISKLPISEDFSFFRNLSDFLNTCLQGKFYDNIVQANNYEYTRAQIKDLMIPILFKKPIFYSRPTKYNLKQRIFSASYPLIMDILKIINKKHNAHLAIYLQIIESTLFIDIICKILFDNGIIPVFTIHDSIVVETIDAERAKQIIENTFQDIFGFIPKFGLEKTGTANYKPAQSSSTIKVA